MGGGGVLCARHKRRMVGVDLCGLNINETLHIIRGRSQHLSQQLRNNVDNPGMEAREPLEFLRVTLSINRTLQHIRAYRTRAIVANLDQFSRRVQIRQHISKDVVEGIVYPGSSGKSPRGYFDARPIDRRDKVPSELDHKSENDRSLLIFVTEERLVTKGVELLSCLPRERVETCFHV